MTIFRLSTHILLVIISLGFGASLQASPVSDNCQSMVLESIASPDQSAKLVVYSVPCLSKNQVHISILAMNLQVKPGVGNVAVLESSFDSISASWDGNGSVSIQKDKVFKFSRQLFEINGVKVSYFH